MKLLVLAELIPLVLMGAAAQTPSCVEQRPANEASVTGASGSLEDLSRYSPEELEIFQARCDQEIKAAIDRGDNAGVQSWARLRAAVIAEKQRRVQMLAPPTPSPTPHKTATRRHRYQPARKSTSAFGAVIFFSLATSVFRRSNTGCVVNAAAGFAVAIQQQLEVVESDPSPARLAEKTIEYAEAKTAYFTAPARGGSGTHKRRDRPASAASRIGQVCHGVRDRWRRPGDGC